MYKQTYYKKVFCRSAERFSTSVHFCYFTGRSRLQSTPCGATGDGWIPNFILNGGASQTPDTIPLYAYYNLIRGQQSDSLFLNRNVNLNLTVFRSNGIYYIPGIHTKSRH